MENRFAFLEENVCLFRFLSCFEVDGFVWLFLSLRQSVDVATQLRWFAFLDGSASSP
jgi:hypothetical protein